MARRPRLQLPGAIYHVMSRGNRKGSIFDDDVDRRSFLAILSEAAERFEVALYAYCLMSNHYHLVIATPRENLSQAMRHVNGVYTQASNRRHSRSGHLYEGRFRSIVVEREPYLQAVARYVVLNPVRAGLVKHPSEWAWSSFRATAGLEPSPSFLQVQWIAWAFGGASLSEAQMNYRIFVEQCGLADADLNVDRLAFGTKTFESALRETASARDPNKHLPRACPALGRPTLADLFDDPHRTRAQRNQLIKDAYVKYGYHLVEIAVFLGLRPGTPSKIIRRLRDCAPGSGLDSGQG